MTSEVICSSESFDAQRLCAFTGKFSLVPARAVLLDAEIAIYPRRFTISQAISEGTFPVMSRLLQRLSTVPTHNSGSKMHMGRSFYFATLPAPLRCPH
ncbi:medea, partial [Moniliophthora roreri]